jgi:hypothetical protein
MEESYLYVIWFQYAIATAHPRSPASVILDPKLFLLRIYFERTIIHNVYLILFSEIYMSSIF